jgi:GNAT superfamily N-acetyltransferase
VVGKFFDSISPEAMYKRFGRGALGAKEIEMLTKADNLTTLIASIGGRIVGLANICPHATPLHVCGIALLVHQDHQRKGIGKILNNDASAIANATGFTRIEELVLKENTPMVKWWSGEPGFIDRKTCADDPAWWQFSMSLEEVGLQPVAAGSMREYVRPPEEAGEKVERLLVAPRSSDDQPDSEEDEQDDEPDLSSLDKKSCRIM